MSDTEFEGFGSTNYSDEKYQTWKLPKADGSFLLRPLPPMKSMRGRAGVGLYWKIHFGWKGTDSKDPTKTRHRPFLCLEEKREGMITQTCPACKLRKAREDKIKAIEAKGLELKKSGDEIRKAQAPHQQWLRDHGLDGKVRIPAYDKKGQVGILLSPYGLYKDFRDKCKALNQKGHDPCGIKGFFFEFIRTGKASFNSDKCEVHQIAKMVEGEEVFKNDVSPLTKEIAAAAMENIPDLNELMEKQRYSLDKIEALCALTERSDGSYDPREVDRILGVVQQEQKPKSDDNWEDSDSKSDTKSDSKTKSKEEPQSVEDDDFGGGEETKTPPPKTEPKTEPKTKKEEPKAPPKEEPPADETVSEDDWGDTFK